MKEEDNILKKVGTDNPFKVPDNYFEEFTSNLMKELPEQNETNAFDMPEPSRWEKVKPLLYLAATFIGIAFIIQSAVFFTPKTDAGATEDMAISTTSDELLEGEYIDYILDGSMMDDYEMYVYLTELK